MYDVRHCWIAHAIDKGLELSTVAHMAGTSVEMLVKNYYELHAVEQLRAIKILGNLEGGIKKILLKLFHCNFACTLACLSILFVTLRKKGPDFHLTP